METYRTAFNIYKQFKKFPNALRIAQKMNNMDLIDECMDECKDPITLKQLAVMLGRQRNPYTSPEDDLNEIISNNRLSEHFKHLARDLDTLTPKHPDHIYKSHLEKNFN